MNQRELSEKVGRHQSTVSRWLSGARAISPEEAVKLEEVTGIDRRAWLWPQEWANPWMPRDVGIDKDRESYQN